MNSSWTTNIVHSGEAYTQSNPSAIFVPKSINGLANGRIWVAWHGTDSTSSSNSIRMSYSDDSGVTWSNEIVVAKGYPYERINASITANKNNDVFILHQSDYASGRIFYNKLTSGSTTWGEIVQITNLDKGGNSTNASSLLDFNLDFSIPLFIYKDSTSGSNKVRFTGELKTTTKSPTTKSTIVYDIPSTDYLGAFVLKEGNVNIEAYVNNELMDGELEGNEYMYTKIRNENKPVKLRLELSRENTNNGDKDKVTRVLGGRA